MSDENDSPLFLKRVLSEATLVFSLAIPILWPKRRSIEGYHLSNFNGLSFWTGLTLTSVNCTNNTLVPTIILIRNEYCKVFYVCTR